MRILRTGLLFSLFVAVAYATETKGGPEQVRFVTPRGERDPGPMGKYDTATASDGKIRLRALWVRSVPAHEILSESGVSRLSDKEGWTYEFYVLVENVGKEEVELPSIIDRVPRSMGMPIGDGMIVPYVVKFEDLHGVTFVESAAAFRPVKLRPGESMRLPIYYRIGKTLEPHWFFYAVEESVAKRYGWWSGALKCQAEEYLPNQTSEPTAQSGRGSP